MPQPPVSPLVPYEQIRSMPYCSQRTFLYPAAQPLAGNAILVAAFDLGAKTTDPNQFLLAGGQLNPALNPALPAIVGWNALDTQVAIGPWLDAVWTSNTIGSVDVAYAVDYGCPYQSVQTIGVQAGITGNISALRVTARFVRVAFTNGANPATMEFGVYIRSQ
jgi:hypothetical protein